jgi:inosose dehydratase
MTMKQLTERIAGAPISWGVCEVPGWGHQLSPQRVLTEMRQVGLSATEFGPEDFLPSEPSARARLLTAHGLSAVGGFVPVLLHEPDRDPLPGVRRKLAEFTAADAETLVLAADTGQTGYDSRLVLDGLGWKTLFANLERIADIASEVGVTATLHPHVGTIVERRDEVERILDGSNVALCLDTGHLLVGGTDPAEIAARAPDRIAHVHLKDVDADMAEQVRSGSLAYSEAVRAGMYRPLGQGDVDIAGIVASLEGAGYDGWYVMEQDTVLAEEPKGEGPLADVRTSVGFLRSLV